MSVPLAGYVLAAAVLGESAEAWRRFESRKRLFAAAQARATALGRSLVVIGAPANGAHTSLVQAYGCGDVCVDLTGCGGCPASVELDITRGQVATVTADSAVVYVSCVIEYVSDPAAAYREILRMAGSPANVFIVTVSAWSLTARFYPGARWIITAAPPTSPELRYRAVGTGEKIAAAGLVAGLGVATVATWPRGTPPIGRTMTARRQDAR